MLGAEIFPFRPHEIFFFLFENDGKKVVIAPDETKYMNLDRIPQGLDLLIKECGFFHEDTNGNVLITDDMIEKGWKFELAFEETIKQVEDLKPKKTVLTEISELFRRTPNDYAALEKQYKNLNITFGWDGMQLVI